jgi:hypothetical protein
MKEVKMELNCVFLIQLISLVVISYENCLAMPWMDSNRNVYFTSSYVEIEQKQNVLY